MGAELESWLGRGVGFGLVVCIEGTHRGHVCCLGSQLALSRESP